MSGNPLRIVVTGGAGFLGSHLCERLLDAGHRVTCLDNFFTAPRQNVVRLASRPNFELIEHDIIEPIFLDAVDRVYNLACPASPVHYQHNPIRTIKASVLGVIHVLGFAKRVGARVLQASTSEVYGDPTEHPQAETYRGNVNTVGPRACYDEGKRCAETLFFDYHREHGVDIRVARIFNTYGPYMHPHDGRVVSNFILQALAGRDLTVQGDGSQTRSFCYVDDLIEGLIRLMEGPAPGPVNLGNPQEVTVRELAERVIAFTGSRSKIVQTPLPADDPTRRCPDIGLARRVLDWAPTVDLETGLGRTVEYFRRLDLTLFERPTPRTAAKS